MVYLDFWIKLPNSYRIEKSKSGFTLLSWKMSDMKYLNCGIQSSTLGYKTLILWVGSTPIVQYF